MNATFATKAWMWCQKHRSGNVSFKVQVGRTHLGKPDIRTFQTEAEAVAFRDDWNAKLVTKNTNGLTDLSTVQRAEVLAALAKLAAFNATLTEAVDFFLKHARPDKGQIKIEDAVKVFLEAKRQLKLSKAYLKGCSRTFLGPFAKYFAGRNVTDITLNECERYLDTHDQWKNATRTTHINHLRALYSFLIKKCYTRLNPFLSIERPRTVNVNPKTMPPQDVQKLLQFALDEGSKPECACLVLAFFCGLRIEGECSRLTWQDVDFDARKVKVSHEQSKTSRRRVNPIPDNAWEWLNLCKGTGRIAPNDYKQRMKRLRQRAKEALKIPYPNNAARHCFCSYHIAQNGDAKDTAIILGHTSPVRLYATYLEFVKASDASIYWSIVPASVKPAWDERAKQEAAQAKWATIKSELQKQANQI
jgi:integrase